MEKNNNTELNEGFIVLCDGVGGTNIAEPGIMSENDAIAKAKKIITEVKSSFLKVYIISAKEVKV